MDKSTEKIISLNESILIWDRIYNKYPYDKFSAIEELYKEGKISKDSYKYGCPLCEKYWDCFCVECPWHSGSYDFDPVRCTNDNSPYKIWENAVYNDDDIVSEEVKQMAKDVLNLLMSIKIGK